MAYHACSRVPRSSALSIGVESALSVRTPTRWKKERPEVSSSSSCLLQGISRMSETSSHSFGRDRSLIKWPTRGSDCAAGRPCRKTDQLSAGFASGLS